MSFPTGGLVPGVTKYVIGNHQYVWNGVAWDLSGSIAGNAVEGMQADIDATEVVANAAAPQSTTYTKVESDAISDAISLDKVSSDITGLTAAKVNNMVKMTQADYDGITPDANTFYIIVG